VTFLHPWMLLLLAVPVLLAWSAIGRRPGLVVPFDHAPQRRRRLLQSVLGFFDLVPLALLAIAIVVLSGPQTLQQPRRERSLTNIEICLDVSGSMTGRNYELAAKAIEDFTLAREGDAFGLTLFGVEQIRWMPLTKDLQAIRDSLPFADPGRQPSHMGGTMIGSALRFCRRNMLAETDSGDRMIVLVSDGFSADLSGGESFAIGEELAEDGIVVYHVHIDESDVPPDVEDLVETTGGEAFAASDSGRLEAIFRHIDRMKPARFEPAGTVPLDEFRPFALAAIGLVSLHVIGLCFVRYTPW
jgi:Ca-activated chloride channel family protein